MPILEGETLWLDGAVNPSKRPLTLLQLDNVLVILIYYCASTLAFDDEPFPSGTSDVFANTWYVCVGGACMEQLMTSNDESIPE